MITEDNSFDMKDFAKKNKRKGRHYSGKAHARSIDKRELQKEIKAQQNTIEIKIEEVVSKVEN